MAPGKGANLGYAVENVNVCNQNNESAASYADIAAHVTTSESQRVYCLVHPSNNPTRKGKNNARTILYFSVCCYKPYEVKYFVPSKSWGISWKMENFGGKKVTLMMDWCWNIYF